MSSNLILAPTSDNFPTIFSYPLKMCSMLVIIVVPSAIIPATNIAAPARKSVATTSRPFNLVLPRIIAFYRII